MTLLAEEHFIKYSQLMLRQQILPVPHQIMVGTFLDRQKGQH